MADQDNKAAPGARYVIGVDLGTTNTAVSYVDLAEERPSGGGRTVRRFEIPQLVAPGEFGHAPVLPSFLYLPGAHDLAPGSTAVPWDADRAYVVGTFAREQGARVPGRLVSSAKSWLSHARVDRTAKILPWQAPAEVPKVSPVEASRRYLQHLREAWNDAMAAGASSKRFENQRVVLTVPASFDEVARELTVRAARDAGLPHVVLLEEPLAAFYAWLHDHAGTWRDRMKAGELILVCDVGGGTTDFSIVGLSEGDDGLRFDRLAVGEHLMLGGDNMDNALGRHLELKLAGGTGKLDVQRWHQLVYQCRRAKETLLGETELDAVDVAVAGTGGRLIAGTLRGTLERDEVRRLVVDGFFPEVPLDAPLQTARAAGLRELGLPYEQDPAVTRHLAAFWRRFQPILREQTGRATPYPDYVLFNGGVFVPEALRERVKALVADWFAPEAGTGWAPEELRSTAGLDLAVSIGAAQYGVVRLGEGIRVGSGSARAYYVGVAAAPAGDGGASEEDIQPAVCLVPRGADEGFEGWLDRLEVEALTNRPVTLHLFSSTTRAGDALGDVVALPPAEVHTLPPIRTVLQFGRKGVVQQLPVELGVRLTEVGTLELWCQSRQTEHRWQLQFDVRQDPELEADVPLLEETLDPARIDAAQALVRETFENKTPVPNPDRFWSQLEDTLGRAREDWPVPLLRRLADAVLAAPRDRSMRHEEVWFDLLGYGLRPGYGDPADDFRMQQAWKHYMEGLRFPQNEDSRIAWWIFWRRVGGGLPPEKQAQVYYEVRPFLQLQVRTGKQHRIYPRRLSPKEKMAAFAALGSFERLPVDIKVGLGQLLVQHMKDRKPKNLEMWALARLGTRLPVYGPLDALVPREEVEAWLQALLVTHLPRRESVGYALAHLARQTGHRDRDLSEDVRQQVHRWLRKMEDEEHFRDLLADPDPDAVHGGRDWFLGEAPPPVAGTLLDPHAIALRKKAAALDLD